MRQGEAARDDFSAGDVEEAASVRLVLPPAVAAVRRAKSHTSAGRPRAPARSNCSGLGCNGGDERRPPARTKLQSGSSVAMQENRVLTIHNSASSQAISWIPI